MFPPSKRIVRAVRDNDGEAMAIRAHSPDTLPAIMIHVRRSHPVSTIGEYRKYQTLGIEEIAMTSAMRSGVTPCLRRRKGMSTTMTPLNAPYGMKRIPNNHGGLCCRLCTAFVRGALQSSENQRSPSRGTCGGHNRTVPAFAPALSASFAKFLLVSCSAFGPSTTYR